MTDLAKFEAAFDALKQAVEESRQVNSQTVTISLVHAARLVEDIREMDRHLPDFFDNEYDPDDNEGDVS